jgi:hypothetical protein
LNVDFLGVVCWLDLLPGSVIFLLELQHKSSSSALGFCSGGFVLEGVVART